MLNRATYEPLRAVREARREETEGFRGLRRGSPLETTSGK
jgi:hypothetical protein